MEDKLHCDANPDSKYFGMLKPINIKNTSFFYLPKKINKIGRSNECDIIFTVKINRIKFYFNNNYSILVYRNSMLY